jgi:hypothetical protein
MAWRLNQDADVFLVDQKAQSPVEVGKLVSEPSFEHVVLGCLVPLLINALDLEDDLSPLVLGQEHV